MGLSIASEPWGSVDGQAVSLYTLANAHEITIRISNYGGVVQSILAPDRGGRMADIGLGFSNLDEYVRGRKHAGAIIGRYANRIANGQFTLNGTVYHLPQNDGTNTLHGGPDAFNTKVWTAGEQHTPDAVGLKLAYTDPDGYNGFPGAVTVEVTYLLTDENELQIHYSATTTKPTVVNFTNHTYFNLAGQGSGDVFEQLLRINADRYTPVNSNLIPTGQLAPVADMPFDFRHAKPIAHGFDHNWVLNGTGMRLAAFAEDPHTGRTLTTLTTEPGLQLYSGNSDGFALETQHFPNSPNEPSFPSTVLKPGQTFDSTTVYRFGVAP